MKNKRKRIVLDGESQSSSDSSGEDDSSVGTVNKNARRSRRLEFSIKAKDSY